MLLLSSKPAACSLSLLNTQKKTGLREQTEDAGTRHRTVSAVPVQTKHEALLLSATLKTGGQRTQGALNEPSEAPPHGALHVQGARRDVCGAELLAELS